MKRSFLCYDTLRAIGKISVKNAKRFDKKWRFSFIWCAIFQNDRRSIAVRYGTLENSDKNGLPTVSNTNNNFTKRLNHEIKYGRARGSSIKGQNCDSTNE
jgi:hypothetical protein